MSLSESLLSEDDSSAKLVFFCLLLVFLATGACFLAEAGTEAAAAGFAGTGADAGFAGTGAAAGFAATGAATGF